MDSESYDTSDYSDSDTSSEEEVLQGAERSFQMWNGIPTPDFIRIDAGEDMVQKVIAFSERQNGTVHVMSAHGKVSLVNVRHANGLPIAYEGNFEIMTFGGMVFAAETSPLRPTEWWLTISMILGDGSLIGGKVSGSVVTATPAHVVVLVMQGSNVERPSDLAEASGSSSNDYFTDESSSDSDYSADSSAPEADDSSSDGDENGAAYP